MDIRVSGHQVDTGEALRIHVIDRLQTMAEKFFSRTISAQVTFGLAPHKGFCCDIICHVMQGLVLKGAGEAQDAHLAFEQAADRIEKQLRRYMRRLKDKHGKAEVARVNGEVVDGAAYTIFHGGHEDEEAPDAPLIVAETRVDIPETSVSDAVMMLDLRNTNALLFLNSGTSNYNMVYRRHDGTIGWVEPRNG
ncbi:ribosome hibernation-promoting factor, HPF/YfiA family [Rhizorhapis suberifaciens]|uniref:Ribosome hibernation promoting factor n=1 Tax=Rhizorhapis suberifaciens TaxID=13656 RepID=A0A840HSU4_9SPHN|nr:ribosome-associated translation inhibitor RaiA [Rhizorhapis suberifaciens]MBB4640781.1 ribosomal subunit interface protein [Rhizorhapis suberifaciens]